MQINSNNEIAKINPALNNDKIAEKKEPSNNNNNVGYAEKQAAPANSNYYMAMYGVKNTKAEEKQSEVKSDDAKYRKAMGEYLAKYGTAEQIKEFNSQAEKKEAAAVETEEDASYRKAMGEYLEKWGTPEQIKEFNGTAEVKNEAPAVSTSAQEPAKSEPVVKEEAKVQTTEDDDAKYRKAMGEYLAKWGTPEQIEEFNKKEATTSTPVSELPDPSEVKFASEEDKKYYEQYLEYKHKYE